MKAELPRLEPMKQLIEMAVAAGHKRLQSQTGFIHYSPQASEGEVHYPIPVYENIGYVLALFRTKMSENILEGKAILEKLLFFECEGNYPIYLHEYPRCPYGYNGVQLLPPLYWIYKNFHSILGSDLKERLQKNLLSLCNFALKLYRQNPCHYTTKIKLGAALQAVGSLIESSEIEIQGKEIMDQLMREGPSKEWYDPSCVAEICIALQMLYSNFSESPWQTFWNHLSNSWQRSTCSYIGPVFKDAQSGFEACASLYDLFLGYFSGLFSQRALVDHAFHMQAALIQTTTDRLEKIDEFKTFQGVVKESEWQFRQSPSYAYSFANKTPFSDNLEKLFSSFKMTWGDSKRSHSFVCQGGNFKEMKVLPVEGGFDFYFNLGDMIPVEIREKNREISFYFDAEADNAIKTEGVPSTTFQLNQEITWKAGSLAFSLSFHLEKGEGHFMGHLMRGNRPSQMKLKSGNRFDAFDWQIFLRTLRRSEPCEIRVCLRIKEWKKIDS